MSGGLFHGIQLWVNLPRVQKMSPPRYQDLASSQVGLLTSADGGALIRVIAGDLEGVRGPGMTYTPIVYAHATVSPGASVTLPWPRDFNAMLYALNGHGTVGPDRRPFGEGQLALFGAGDHITFAASESQTSRSADLDVLLLGGRPINEPIFHYGPFVMNTRDEVVQAVTDFQEGRMGIIPASERLPHS